MKRITSLLKGTGIYAVIILLILSSCKKEDQNEPPWIQLISPLDNSNIESGDSLEIIAEAGDPDGSISKVLFYIDEALVLQDQETPYKLQWNNVPAGNYNIDVRAIDDKNCESSIKHSALNAMAGNTFDVIIDWFPDQPIAMRENIITVKAANNENPVKSIELEIAKTGSSSGIDVVINDTIMVFTWIPQESGHYSIDVTITDTKERSSVWSDFDFYVYPLSLPEIEMSWEYGSFIEIVPGYDLTITLETESNGYPISNTRLYFDDTVVAETFNGEILTHVIPQLSSGAHTYYGVVYNIVGDSTLSNKHTQDIMIAVPVNGVISDIVPTDQPDGVYALDATNSKLLVLNPLLKTISGEFDLPELNPVACSFASGENKLLIVSQYSGNITLFDENTEQFQSISFSVTADGLDIMLDVINRRIYIISTEGLFILDFDTHEVLLAGGNPIYYAVIKPELQQLFALKNSKLYKYDVSNDLLEIIQTSQQIISSDKIILNPDHQSVLLRNYNEMGIYSTDDINEVLAIREVNNYTQCYNQYGDKLFVGENIFSGIIDKIHIYDTEVYFGYSEFEIPNIDAVSQMITNSDDSFLIVFTYSEDYNNNHFIFFFEL